MGFRVVVANRGILKEDARGTPQASRGILKERWGILKATCSKHL
jgi:hypothetical protein